MRLGISNIALKGQPFDEALKRLKRLSVNGMDIAPGLLWDEPLKSSKAERQSIKKLITENGIQVVGLQALFFHRPELQLFESDKTRSAIKEHLKRMMELCVDLGGIILTFGAAKNRRRAHLSSDEALAIAVPFFRDVGVMAQKEKLFFCLEPLSTVYDCDFILTADDGGELIKLVDHPNFRLLLDTGSMILNGEPGPDMIIKHADLIKHMHINDPNLAAPGAKGIDHKPIAAALEKIHYKGWLSMEFLPGTKSLEEDISYAIKCYAK